MSQFWCEKRINIWFRLYNKIIVRSIGKIHQKLSTFCSSHGLIYIDNRNIRGGTLHKRGHKLDHRR